MISLTDRLQMLADSIENGETMADIGTDHGFLPLYLWENEISPSVIMCDISEPSLDKARFAASAYDDDEGLYFRAGDGLKVLEKGEVDAVVIAGMGGLLMIDILSEDIAKTRSYSKFVLQPRNNAAKLRLWLEANDFRIIENNLVREGKFICEILVVASSASTEPVKAVELEMETEPEYEITEDMIKYYPQLAKEFALAKASIEDKIISGIKLSAEPDTNRLAICQKRLDYFREVAND